MKKIYLVCAFCIFITLSDSLEAQSLVYLNDSVYLSLQGLKHGQIQWQQSEDSLIWYDIAGATRNNYPVFPTIPLFYRAKVSSGACNLIYSEIIKVFGYEFKCGDTLIDIRDGSRYPTVLIGSQCWMAKNLNIGKMIINGTETASNNQIIEKYCYDNDSNNCYKHGGLYNWNEMMQYSSFESVQGVCPVGWHVPSDQEWITLEVALGMNITVANQGNMWRGNDEGAKLKVGGSSGYNALLSGSGIPGGYFNALNQFEYMYTSTSYNDSAWRRCVNSGVSTVGRWNTFPKTYSLSVRCVKD